MRRFVVIATTWRGDVSPPEPLDAEGQYLAGIQEELDEGADRLAIARRIAQPFMRERDPEMSVAQALRELRRPVLAEVLDVERVSLREGGRMRDLAIREQMRRAR